MTPHEIIRLLRKHDQWLQGKPEGAQADFSKLDLSGLDLSSVNLSRANLSDVSFKNCNLSGANLENANLYAAEFSYSMLAHAISRAPICTV